MQVSKNCCNFAGEMRKVVVVLCVLVSSLATQAEEKMSVSAMQAEEKMSVSAMQAEEKAGVFQGFSGGMMLHTGYLFGTDKAAPLAPDGRSYSPQGALFGIGGAFRVHLWDHLRTGFEGFVSTMYRGMMDNKDILQSGSYVRVACGGVNADACWRMSKVWPYVGASMGGGAMRSLYMLDGNQDSWNKQTDTYFHRQPFFYVTPYVGCDYCLTQRVHLTFRFDWMLAIHHNTFVQPTGPRVYIGFMFCH